MLVVDDEANLLRAVAAVLRDEDFEVATARGGRDALVSVAQSVPDLIVSDVRMPGMSGFELARRLRSAPHSALIPIVFLTAKDETEARVEGFDAGVDVYLTKPFEPDELVAVIKNILRRVERTRSAIARMVGAAEDEKKEEIVVRDEDLTEAERRVAREIARGSSNKEIAKELNISVRTVENHVSRILAKKNFSNRVEIARQILAQNSNEK